MSRICCGVGGMGGSSEPVKGRVERSLAACSFRSGVIIAGRMRDLNSSLKVVEFSLVGIPRNSDASSFTSFDSVTGQHRSDGKINPARIVV
eukprot:3802680-Rhodomonas_salina.1